jgi:hypothetical protein
MVALVNRRRKYALYRRVGKWGYFEKYRLVTLAQYLGLYPGYMDELEEVLLREAAMSHHEIMQRQETVRQGNDSQGAASILPKP